MVKKFFMFKRPFFGIFVALLFSLSIFSCENVTWNQPVHAWFEEYTSTAAVGNYSMTPGAYSYGNLVNVVGSYEDLNIALYMRNPKKYQIDSSIVFDDGFEFNSAECLKQVAYDELSLVIPKDFLRDHDAGGNLSFTVNLKEHVTQRTFKDYHLDLTCNSVPEKAQNPTVLSMSGSPDVFVVAFDMPSADELKKIHKDLVSVDIDGSSYPLSVLEDGSVDFGSAPFSRTSPGTLSAINKQFVHTDRAVYYVTGETFFQGDKSYSITFTDSAGLKSTAVASTTVSKLSYPGVTDNDGNLLYINTEAVLHIDSEDGATGSTVTVQVPDSDDMGNNVDGIKIGYRLMSGNVIQASSGSLNPDPVNVTVPSEGEYTLVVWAEKPGYEKSIEAEYKLKLVYANLKAPVVKDGETELDSGASVTNYIPLPGNGSDASVTICLPTQDESGNNVSDVTMSYLLKFSTAASGSPIDDIKADKPVGGLSLGIWDLSVTASKPGYKASQSEYTIRVFGTDMWVKADGKQYASGTATDPYDSITHAADDIKKFNKSNLDYTIHVVSDLSGYHTIPSGLNAKSITIQGENGNKTLNGFSSYSVLDVEAPVTIDIKNLTLTGGYRGIYINNSNAVVNLGSGAVISGNTASSGQGAGVYVNAGKLDIQTGSVIKDNHAQWYGGGVYVAKGAEAVLSGGTIGGSVPADKNSASRAGGGVCCVGGTFTMTGGTVEGNLISGSGSVYGGGVYVMSQSVYDGANPKYFNDGTFVMSGGSIKKNKVAPAGSNSGTAMGGGVAFRGHSFTMSGGTIEENTATLGFGGGIYYAANSGTYGGLEGTITSGTINKNSAARGGGISVDGSSGLKLAGGTVGGSGNDDGNTATAYGGGVYVECMFILDGGEIKGNKLSGSNAKGSGVAVSPKKTAPNFRMRGAAKVDSGNDVYLPQMDGDATTERTIIVDGALTSGYPVAVITPYKYDESSPPTLLTGSKYGTEHMKFAVTDNDPNDEFSWGVDVNGKLTKGQNAAQATAALLAAKNSGDDNLVTTIKIVGPVPGDLCNSIYEVRKGVDLNNKTVKLDLSSASSTPVNFTKCYALSEVKLPAGIKSFSGSSYADCFFLTDVSFVGENDVCTKEDGVIYSKNKKELLLYCNKVNEVTIFTVPASVTKINKDAFDHTHVKEVRFESGSAMKTIDQAAFSYSYLEKIVIPNSVTSIGSEAFFQAWHLKSVTLPSGLTKIPSQCFSNCTELGSKLVVPDNVTEIGDRAFFECTDLTDIVLPKKLKKIGYRVFVTASGGVERVLYRGTELEKEGITIGSDNGKLLDATWTCNYTGN